MHKTIVVGAGPVGIIAAIYAAARGDQVEVYEKRKGSLPMMKILEQIHHGKRFWLINIQTLVPTRRRR